MGNTFIQFDWPFYGRPEGGKKGCACVHGRVYLLGDRTGVCVDNRVHDKECQLSGGASAGPRKPVRWTSVMRKSAPGEAGRVLGPVAELGNWAGGTLKPTCSSGGMP